MKYSRVHMEFIGYELAPVVVQSSELEGRLAPVYNKLKIPMGQVEALTGIEERRWWDRDYPVSRGAAAAAKKALSQSPVKAEEIEVLIYTGVCRENYEPATACRVASELGISSSAAVFDISNACLGVMNGIIEVANRIELGQIGAGMVVSCESAREIVDTMIEKMLADPSMEMFKYSIATLTGGSGAVAVILTDGRHSRRRKLVGGVMQNAPEHHGLCHWGVQANGNGHLTPFMSTDSVNVLKHGVTLGERTWQAFHDEIGWNIEDLDRVICHQVGSEHRRVILETLGISEDIDYSTHSYLGNMGTVSLPLTAALAEERDFLETGHKVGFFGIGSGLNCLMLGWEW